MTIDQNQTPVGEEEAQQSAIAAVPASDPSSEANELTETPIAESIVQQETAEVLPMAEASSPSDEQVAEVTTTLEPTTEAPVAEAPASAEAESVHESISEPVAVVEDSAEAQAITPENVSEVTVDASAEPEAEPVAEVVTEVVAEPVSEAVAEVPARDVKADADLFEAAMRGDFGEDMNPTEGGFKRLQKGERIEATIIQVDKDKVFVDLGTKAEGIVPLGELSDENLETAKGRFNVGDKISVIVIRPEGAEGNPIVSKRRAEFEEAWDRIEEAFRTQEMITAQVVDRVKGGLVVDVGVRGFVPATHVGSGKLRNIEKYVGQPLQLKVIEIDRERKKVVLSNRQAEEERRASAKENIFTAVKPGDALDGTVRRLTDYGAFVDLGGVDGLLHISEMSWARINHPKEMFKEGQKIKVMVLRLDANAGKISLGHRQVLPDPWNLIKQNYTVGQKLTITIGRIVQSGAFIKLPEGAEAFMPVSEMSFRRIKRPQDVVEENQEVEAQIIDLRPDERRMVLSMRAIGGGGELRPGADRSLSPAPTTSYDDEMRRGGADRGKKKGKKGGRGRDDFEDFDDVGGRRGFATGGATIGERLGLLKGFLDRTEDEEETEEKAETTEE